MKISISSNENNGEITIPDDGHTLELLVELSQTSNFKVEIVDFEDEPDEDYKKLEILFD